MSLHPSLRQTGGKTGRLRNVLKRYERLRLLLSQGPWPEGRSIFGLPKTKQERVKVRKAAPAPDSVAKASDAPAETPKAPSAT